MLSDAASAGRRWTGEEQVTRISPRLTKEIVEQTAGAPPPEPAEILKQAIAERRQPPQLQRGLLGHATDA